MANVKKLTDTKKIKKKWIQILASKEFNNQQVGETYLEEPKHCIGRVININLMILTKESKNQNFNVKLKIKEFKENKALTELVSYNIQVAQLKRMTKNGKNKVEDSFGYKTKDNMEITIKPILLTKSLTYQKTLQSLRKVTRDFLTDYSSKNTFSDIMKDVIFGKLQREIKNNGKKVYPLVSCIIKAAYSSK